MNRKTIWGFFSNNVRQCYTRSATVRRFFWQSWYRWFAKASKNVGLQFMNYGYAPASDSAYRPLPLSQNEVPDRYCIQLYDFIFHKAEHQLAPLTDKKILEVGCGRGGGAAYLAKQYAPSEFVGGDICAANITLNRAAYSIGNLRFEIADAEKLPFATESFDGVLNVESSHCYGNFGLFLNEVSRVLRSGGYFYFADLRDKPEVPRLRAAIPTTMEVVEYKEITENVVRALEADSQRRVTLIEKTAPRFAWSAVKEFAGVIGSPILESFKSGETAYIHFILRKI